jgi:aminoglycoside phosphotransferase (APT) family kinase protein
MSVPAPGTASPAGSLEEVLSGRLGAAAVRRVALEPLRGGLDRLLQETGNRPGTLRLLRSKYKPSRLTGWYLLTPDGGGAPRHLVVTWSANDAGTVRVYPDDPALPQLARLSRPGHVAAVLRELADVRDGRLRGQLDVQPVRYRPGQRHVLRVRRGPAEPGYYVKTDRDASGAPAVDAATTLGALLAERCPSVRVAQPVGFCAADRASVWREAGGRPLGQWLAAGVPASTAALQLLGQALREMHDSGLRAPTPAQPAGRPVRHDAAYEVAVTLRAGGHIGALLPAVGTRYRDLAREAGERLDRLPGDPVTLVHGDAKCDNVLVDGDRLRVLDLDRCGTADPALDLGRMLADLRWWCRDDRRAAWWSAMLAHGYGPGTPRRWTRARTWAVLFQLRNAARRCAVHEPGWTEQVRARVADASVAMDAERGAP